MDLSQIDSSFSGSSQPKDEELIARLTLAYNGELDCYLAIVQLPLIKPFSDYRPELSEQYIERFVKLYQDMQPPSLYIYQDSTGQLIMSDDYQAYYTYKELALEEALCTIVGEYETAEGISQIGEGFKLPPPAVEIL